MIEDNFPSKTRRKQEMHALQSLGGALLDLPPSQIDALGIPEELAQAVREGMRIRSREARRRHLQYIGRLMRELDPEPIRAAIAQAEGRSAAARARQRRIERWRERLIADDRALTEFAREHAGVDLQALRTHIRNGRREIARGLAPHAQRALLRFLREACA